jgi:hypothetical protein
MSYLVFIVGLALSVCGAYFINFGYGIVAVERGWASVIAGATALSCGVVTMALAFILRALAQLRASVAAAKGAKALTRESASRRVANPPRTLGRIDKPESLPSPKAFPAPVSAPAPEPPPAAPRAQAEAGRARVEDKARVRAEERTKDFLVASVEAPRAERAPLGALAPPRLPERRGVARASIDDVRRVVADQLKGAPRAESASGLRQGAPFRAAGGAEGDEDVLGRAMEARSGAPADSGSASADSVAPVESFQAAAPEPDGFSPAPEDREAVNAACAGPDEVAPPAEDRPLAEASEEAPFALDAHDRAGQEGSEVESSSEGAGPQSATFPPGGGERGPIVGSYESGGTSYVMYADGSIDAHSARGAFRFNSMAELKAFLDAQG